VAQAYFRIDGRTLEMFGPRAEQIAHLLELQGSKVAKKLGERIGGNVSDAEEGEPILELDDDEERELLVALDAVVEAGSEIPSEIVELRSALRSSLARP